MLGNAKFQLTSLKKTFLALQSQPLSNPYRRKSCVFQSYITASFCRSVSKKYINQKVAVQRQVCLCVIFTYTCVFVYVCMCSFPSQVLLSVPEYPIQNSPSRLLL